ncbi:IS110 family RNA-guided transposase [Azohydromonas lata]|uniref:IS110 family transposase n=1 Tax=Azohydromonas lata TaxID=45677 RepID=A0ABU5IQF0_9BURK|nr:IS110 family transposase [Azohydromonas lata]MDZ5461094.1 IS110 family transposase [Azohydromonas lata]
MGDVSLIGIDLGKHSFHLHAQDSSGRMVFRKKLTRSQLLAQLGNFQACTVAMESCAGAHWLARHLAAMGHQPKLIPPQFVKPFVKGNKNDFADAEAICEAVVRPNMRFAMPHTEAQQALSALHRMREALVGDHTCTTNQIHAFLLEFGISLAKGKEAIKALPVVLARHEDLPPAIVDVLLRLQAHHKYLDGQIADVDREISRQLKADEHSNRLLEIPGIGPVTASALSIELGDPHQFKNARQFAASIGLVPGQYSTGDKPKLLGISKRGDKRLRSLLVLGARSIMKHIERRTDVLGRWVCAMLARRHSNVVACALANKLARIAWAMLARGTHFDAGRSAMAA